MEAYNRCVQAEGKQLYLKTCSEESRQRFLLASDGKLQVSGTDLCVAVGAGKGTPTGGPSHLRRDLLLKPCTDASPELSRWTAPAKLAP
ncbi:MAG: hypothetical protein GY953_30310 [bacterium]|nr:hypothetical protein [bacterium]